MNQGWHCGTKCELVACKCATYDKLNEGHKE